MHQATTIAIILCACVPATRALFADEVRHYTGDDGQTYRETRRVVQRPVTTTEWQERQQTVYRQEWRSETRDSLRAYYTPVTEMRWLSRLHGRWNPFAVPYYTHHLVPVTRWEARADAVQVPTWRAEWKPETRSVRVPVTTHRMAEEEVITRVAVSGPPAMAGSSQIAGRPAPTPVTGRPGTTAPSYGGVALPGDPPRYATGWRSRGTAIR